MGVGMRGIRVGTRGIGVDMRGIEWNRNRKKLDWIERIRGIA